MDCWGQIIKQLTAKGSAITTFPEARHLASGGEVESQLVKHTATYWAQMAKSGGGNGDAEGMAWASNLADKVASCHMAILPVHDRLRFLLICCSPWR